VNRAQRMRSSGGNKTHYCDVTCLSQVVTIQRDSLVRHSRPTHSQLKRSYETLKTEQGEREAHEEARFGRSGTLLRDLGRTDIREDLGLIDYCR